MRKALSAVFSLLMMGAVVVSGGLHLSFWTLPVFFGIFFLVSLYLKWSSLKVMGSLMPLPVIGLRLLLIALTQAVVVAALYFIAYGLDVALTGSTVVSSDFGQREIIACIAGLVGASGLAACYRRSDYLTPFEQRRTLGTNAPGAKQDVSAALPKTQNPAPSPSGEPDTYERLMDDLQDIAESGIVMPVKLYEMGRRFASMGDVSHTLDVFSSKLVFDENMHIRRIVQMTLRFFEHRDFDPAIVHNLVLIGLEDTEDWVRFDALRAGDVLGYTDDDFKGRVEAMADGMEALPLDAPIPPNDAPTQVRVRAARLREKLRAI